MMKSIKNLKFLAFVFPLACAFSADLNPINARNFSKVKKGLEGVYTQVVTSVNETDSLDSKEMSLSSEEEALRVMSFNICWEEQNSNGVSWKERKNYISSTIRFHKADIIGLQEPYKHQLDDLQKVLSDYDWYGVGW